MHDLIVVPTPIPVPPYGVVAVQLRRDPFGGPRDGHVLIEHLFRHGAR